MNINLANLYVYALPECIPVVDEIENEFELIRQSKVKTMGIVDISEPTMDRVDDLDNPIREEFEE